MALFLWVTYIDKNTLCHSGQRPFGLRCGILAKEIFGCKERVLFAHIQQLQFRCEKSPDVCLRIV